MSWKETIREKALIFLNANGTSANSPRWPTAYPAAQAQFFFPNWPDENPAVPLTERRELVNNSLIMTPINWLGTVLSEPPPVVEIEQPDGSFTPVVDSPMLDLLATPNAYHTGELLLKAFAYSWVVYGNVYWYKARNASGQVVELWPLDPANVYPYTDTTKNEFISYYVYKPPIGTEQYLAPQDLIHFRCGLDPRDSRLGLAPIEALWLELAADTALTKYTQAMAQNFGVPPYCVSPEPDPTGTYQLSAELMKSEVTKGTTGANTGKMLIFERPVRIIMMGMSPDQLAVDKSRRIPEERVASVLCIPGVVLGYGSHLDRATYSNVATARRMAYEGCVNPILNLIAAELRKQLLYEFVPRETLDSYWVRSTCLMSPHSKKIRLTCISARSKRTRTASPSAQRRAHSSAFSQTRPMTSTHPWPRVMRQAAAASSSAQLQRVRRSHSRTRPSTSCASLTNGFSRSRLTRLRACSTRRLNENALARVHALHAQLAMADGQDQEAQRSRPSLREL